jgi:hypothetical protein
VSHPGDNFVLYLLIIMILYLLLKFWIPFPRLGKGSKNISEGTHVEMKGEVPELLRQNGYEVIRSKEKTELTITVDNEKYESRLYIDYVARADKNWYIVIVARDRKPLRISGPALRDALLSYYLLYKPHGILYVQQEKRRVKVIDFIVPNFVLQKKGHIHAFYFISLGIVIGILIALFF